MVFMVGNIRVSIEIESNKDKIERSRRERMYQDMLTERHFDQVRSKAIRDAMFMGRR
ncbi:MAG: hypothetical protein H5T95_05770 [Firmicutes bacterium]|nr:hypothetical protein [Bacillota bacterium]